MAVASKSITKNGLPNQRCARMRTSFVYTGSRGAKNRIDLVEDRESVFFSLPLLNEAFFKSLKSAQKKIQKNMKYVS